MKKNSKNLLNIFSIVVSSFNWDGKNATMNVISLNYSISCNGFLYSIYY